MKIAFLISGMYREFDEVAKMLESKNLIKYDFYMSTWNTSKQKYNNSDLYKEFKVTPNMITDYIPHCIYEILNESETFPNKVPNANKMIFHWKNCFKLLVDTGKQYDLICLIRTDLSFQILSKGYTMSDSLNDIDDWEFDRNVLYSNELLRIRKSNTLENDINYVADDLFFCGSRKIIARFINGLPNPFTEYEWIPHITLGNYLFKTNMIPNDIHPFHHCHVIRPKLSKLI
jgi:hypothetical protein